MFTVRQCFSIFFSIVCLTFTVFADELPTHAEIEALHDPFEGSASHDQLESRLLALHYAKASTLMALLQDKKAAILSKQGHVGVDRRTNSLWVEDDPERFKVIKRLIGQLDVPVKQVLIEAKIVRIDVKHVRELGLRFGFTRALSKSDLPDAKLLTFAVPASGISIAKLGDGVLLDLELSALERENSLNIVSTPRLIASNQVSALIESGTEIPYQEKTLGGSTSATFKKAVMRLKVTPQITPDNHVILLLEVRQDKPGVLLGNGQAIDTENMETQVFLKDGQTIVIGGVREKEHRATKDQVPFLGSIPFLGRLFQYKKTQDVQKELLIFITPKILGTPT